MNNSDDKKWSDPVVQGVGFGLGAYTVGRWLLGFPLEGSVLTLAVVLISWRKVKKGNGNF